MPSRIQLKLRSPSELYEKRVYKKQSRDMSRLVNLKEEALELF